MPLRMHSPMSGHLRPWIRVSELDISTHVSHSVKKKGVGEHNVPPLCLKHPHDVFRLQFVSLNRPIEDTLCTALKNRTIFVVNKFEFLFNA